MSRIINNDKRVQISVLFFVLCLYIHAVGASFFVKSGGNVFNFLQLLIVVEGDLKTFKLQLAHTISVCHFVPTAKVRLFVTRKCERRVIHLSSFSPLTKNSLHYVNIWNSYYIFENLINHLSSAIINMYFKGAFIIRKWFNKIWKFITNARRDGILLCRCKSKMFKKFR